MSDIDKAKDVVEDLGRAFEEFKKRVTKSNDEVAEHGRELGQTKEVLERIQDAMDAQNDQMEALRVKLATPTAGVGTVDDEALIRKAALVKVLRNGMSPTPLACLDPDELKTLAINDPSQAGFLAPDEYFNQITKSVEETSKLRGLCRVQRTSLKAVEIPRRTDNMSGGWVSELGTRANDSQLAYAKDRIDVHTQYARIAATREMLRDSAFDIEAELMSEFPVTFAQVEGAAFVNGTGVDQPRGFMTESTDDGGSVALVNSLAAAALTSSGIIDLHYALKTDYAERGTYGMNRLIIRDIRKLTDADGQYLWQPGLALNQPQTLLNRPIVELPDMASAATAGAYPIVFGDFDRFYRIVDRVQLEIVRDQYTQLATGQVIWQGERAVGGLVVDPEAAVIQKVSA